jgi:hypothetical protein
VRAMLFTMCISTMMLAIGFIWARCRWLTLEEQSEATVWPQPWPNPDRLLDWYVGWLLAHNPSWLRERDPSLGYLTLSDVYLTVHAHILRVVFPLLAVGSLAFGLATPELGRWVSAKVARTFSACTSDFG